MTEKLHSCDNTLFYKRLGKGPVVLFIHGFLGDSTIWGVAIEKLRSTYTCVCLDMPEHGKSRQEYGDYTFDSLAKSVESILIREEINEFHIVGHSMGGYLGLSIANLLPAQVKSITLLNSTAKPDSESKKIERDRAARVFDLSPKVYIKAAIENLIYEDNRDDLECEIEQLVDIAHKLTVIGAKSALRAMRDRKDQVPFLLESQLPLLMISGKYDKVCPLKEAIEQLIGLNANHTILENTGHMAFVEEPNRLIEVLEKHLNSY